MMTGAGDVQIGGPTGTGKGIRGRGSGRCGARFGRRGRRRTGRGSGIRRNGHVFSRCGSPGRRGVVRRAGLGFTRGMNPRFAARVHVPKASSATDGRARRRRGALRARLVGADGGGGKVGNGPDCGGVAAASGGDDGPAGDSGSGGDSGGGRASGGGSGSVAAPPRAASSTSSSEGFGPSGRPSGVKNSRPPDGRPGIGINGISRGSQSGTSLPHRPQACHVALSGGRTLHEAIFGARRGTSALSGSRAPSLCGSRPSSFAPPLRATTRFPRSTAGSHRLRLRGRRDHPNWNQPHAHYSPPFTGFVAARAARIAAFSVARIRRCVMQ